MSQGFPSNPTVGSSSQKLLSHQDPPPTDPPQEPQPPTQEPAQPQPQPAGPTIVDVVASYQAGNYLPLLHCLNNNLLSLDFFDQAGYHPIHSAVASNLIPIVVILLDHYHIDINIRAKNGQTPLMIAANYGHLQIIKMLCDRGASVNEQEDTRFSALTYAVKQGHLATFAYLLSQNADINIRDSNGCTITHWAAYKNNDFLLKVLNSLGLDLNILDFTGLTPLERAVQSNAFRAVSYLLEKGNGVMPGSLDIGKVTNTDMKEMLRRKYFKSSLEKKWEEQSQYLQNNGQKVLIGFYLVMGILAIIVYLHAIMGQGSDYTTGLVFMTFGLYFMAYAYWYFSRSPHDNKPTKKRGYDKLISGDTSIDSSREGREMNSRVNYGLLSKLTQNRGGEASWDSTFSTFLHELAYLVQTETYKEVERFYEGDYCPVCLIRRPERSGHCEEEGTCVEDLCHYSYYLKRSITIRDHYLYLIQIINQMFILTFFVFAMWRCYWDRVYWAAFIAEIAYILWDEFGIIYASFYAVTLVLWVYNSCFFALEIYGVLKNIRYYEIFNATKCSYLYRVRVDRKGNYVKRFHNPYDKGAKANIKEYCNRIFH